MYKWEGRLWIRCSIPAPANRMFWFLKAYACESVVDTYCDLLCHFDLLDAQHVHCITTMLHRIFVKCKMEAFFYKV